MIQTYDKEGNMLVESKLAMAKTGYPVDMAVSDDGEKLGVSFLYVDSGIVKTNVGFYNFGSVGQNEIDRLVSAYIYEGSVFPSIEYINETTSVAFGDKKVCVYQGRQRPELVKEIKVEEEIRSVFYTNNYFALVFIVKHQEKDIV